MLQIGKKTPVRGRVPKHQSSGRGVSDFHDIAVCYIPSTVRLLLPAGPPAVRARPSDRPAPLHFALGGDLSPAVQVVSAVVVVVLWVLGDEL